MKKIFLALTCTVAGAALAGFGLQWQQNYETTLIGTWDVVKESVRIGDVNAQKDVSYGKWTYQFRSDDSVYIYMEDIDTTETTTGWELVGTNEDTVLFSEGNYLYIYNKTSTGFKGRFPLGNNTDYMEIQLKKR